MERTVAGSVENIDLATPRMSRGGLRRFAGGRNVLKVHVCSNDYCKESPNATAILAASLSRFTTTTTSATPARVIEIERTLTALSSMPNPFPGTKTCCPYVKELCTSERSLSRLRMWEHGASLEVIDRLRSGHSGVKESLQADQLSLHTLSIRQADRHVSDLQPARRGLLSAVLTLAQGEILSVRQSEYSIHY